MKFTNAELKTFFHDRFMGISEVQITCLTEDGKEVGFLSDERIEVITFDEHENLSIMFWGHQTSIFIQDKEIMFIDENSKATYTLSDVYNNVVYEGKIRDMSHEQMLEMFCEIIFCLLGATDIVIEQDKMPEDKRCPYHKYYEPHTFRVYVLKDGREEKTLTYGNITFEY